MTRDSASQALVFILSFFSPFFKYFFYAHVKINVYLTCVLHLTAPDYVTCVKSAVKNLDAISQTGKQHQSDRQTAFPATSWDSFFNSFIPSVSQPIHITSLDLFLTTSVSQPVTHSNYFPGFVFKHTGLSANHSFTLLPWFCF